MPRTRRPLGALDITISLGCSYSDSAPVAQTLSFAALIKRFALPDTKRGKLPFAEYQALDKNIREQKKIAGNEKNGEYFIPATFKKPRVRTADQIDRIFGFVLDFDSGKTTQKVIEEKLCGLSYVGYTSYSHTPDAPRFRVFIPYCKPITLNQHVAVFEHFYAMFGGDIDLHSKNAAQIWYTPACPPDAGNMFVSFSGAGNYFDAMAVAPKLRAVATSTPTAKAAPALVLGSAVKVVGAAPKSGPMSQSDIIRSALNTLNADDYDHWIKVGLALKNEMGDAGFLLWQEFAASSTKFDSTESVARWNGFKPKDSADKKITMRSIFYIAKQRGWIEPPGAEPTEIANLNSEYFLALDGGKAMLYREEVDPLVERNKLVRMAPSDFRLLLGNKFIEVAGGKSMKLGDYWLNHPKRREYKSIMFAPGGAPDDVYNLWRGFSIAPKRGRWKLLRDHIRKIVCAGNAVHADYLLNWMADAIQNPGRPAGVAVVMKGGQGTGKGKLGQWFGNLFGQHYLHVLNARHIVGNFNAHLRDAVFLFADEAIWAGDKAAESVLKGLITEPLLVLEQKGVDSITVPNNLHIMMASNEDWVVPAAADDRRFFVLELSPERQKDLKYFAAIDTEMEAGGRAAMLYDLMHRDISAFNIRSVPRTHALDQQKVMTFDLPVLWWFEILKSGELPFRDGSWGMIPKDSLVVHFQNYVKFVNSRQRASETTIGMLLHKILPKGWPKSKKVAGSQFDRNNKGQVAVYLLPPLAECRSKFETYASMQGFNWQP